MRQCVLLVVCASLCSLGQSSSTPSPASPPGDATTGIPVQTNTWAVLVSTSRYWFNYRHIANTLSFYHTVKRLGIPDSQIILMLPDDMACNTRNSLPASVFNNQRRAIDLYGDEVEVDYRGSEVTVENFLRVLTGRVHPDTPRSKRLESDGGSNILIYLTGHGGDQFIKFQDREEMSAQDLADAVHQMHLQQRYRAMLIIADTCQAGTLSSRMSSPNVIAIGSSKLGENSYSHHADTEIGVTVIDRFTYYTLDFFERRVHGEMQSRGASSAASLKLQAPSLQELFDFYDPSLLRSHVSYRSDLYTDSLRNVSVLEFFAQDVPLVSLDTVYELSAASPSDPAASAQAVESSFTRPVHGFYVGGELSLGRGGGKAFQLKASSTASTPPSRTVSSVFGVSPPPAAAAATAAVEATVKTGESGLASTAGISARSNNSAAGVLAGSNAPRDLDPRSFEEQQKAMVHHLRKRGRQIVELTHDGSCLYTSFCYVFNNYTRCADSKWRKMKLSALQYMLHHPERFVERGLEYDGSGWFQPRQSSQDYERALWRKYLGDPGMEPWGDYFSLLGLALSNGVVVSLHTLRWDKGKHQVIGLDIIEVPDVSQEASRRVELAYYADTHYQAVQPMSKAQIAAADEADRIAELRALASRLNRTVQSNSSSTADRINAASSSAPIPEHAVSDSVSSALAGGSRVVTAVAASPGSDSTTGSSTVSADSGTYSAGVKTTWLSRILHSELWVGGPVLLLIGIAAVAMKYDLAGAARRASGRATQASQRQDADELEDSDPRQGLLHRVVDEDVETTHARSQKRTDRVSSKRAPAGHAKATRPYESGDGATADGSAGVVDRHPRDLDDREDEEEYDDSDTYPFGSGQLDSAHKSERLQGGGSNGRDRPRIDVRDVGPPSSKKGRSKVVSAILQASNIGDRHAAREEDDTDSRALQQVGDAAHSASSRRFRVRDDAGIDVIAPVDDDADLQLDLEDEDAGGLAIDDDDDDSRYFASHSSSRRFKL